MLQSLVIGRVNSTNNPKIQEDLMAFKYMQQLSSSNVITKFHFDTQVTINLNSKNQTGVLLSFLCLSFLFQSIINKITFFRPLQHNFKCAYPVGLFKTQSESLGSIR
jgi:hypothetical protein